VPQDLVAYRRDLPGGRTVMITIDDAAADDDAAEEGTPSPVVVVGRLMLERRTDPERRRAGEPPIVAEVRGATRGEVLASLKALAESEGEVARRLDAWLTSRHSAERQLPPGQRVRMSDGTWWSVERRAERPPQGGGGGGWRTTPARGSAAIQLWFHGGDGALRQAVVPADFPAEASTAELQAVWSRADVVK
jgi:hypothetical protein